MPCQSFSLINCEFLELFSSRQIGVECLLCKKSRKLKQFIFFFFFLKLHFLTLEWEKLKDWTNPKTLCIDRSKLISSTEIEKKKFADFFFHLFIFFFQFWETWYPEDPPVPSWSDPSILCTKITWLSANNGGKI